MKKIFVVSQPEVVNETGGAITVFFTQCDLLCRNGYEVLGICDSPVPGRPEKLNPECRFVNLRYNFEKYEGFRRAFNALTETEKPDLIIFHFSFLYINAGLKFRFRGIPRILAFHSRPDIYFKYHGRGALRKVYANTVSQILFDSYYHLLPLFIRLGRVVSIPNCVPETDFRADTRANGKKFVYLSRIDLNKGVEFLTDALSLVKDKEVSIDIYGRIFKDEYKKELEERIVSAGLERRICFKGITSTPQKTLSGYSACVFPSFFEGFSIGLAEALSVGLPCIGRRSASGVNEQIADGFNGLLSDDSPKDFARCIDLLSSEAELRVKMSENALESTKKYSKEIIDNQWLELIGDILDGKKIKRRRFKKSPYALMSTDKMR